MQESFSRLYELQRCACISVCVCYSVCQLAAASFIPFFVEYEWTGPAGVAKQCGCVCERERDENKADQLDANLRTG